MSVLSGQWYEIMIDVLFTSSVATLTCNSLHVKSCVWCLCRTSVTSKRRISTPGGRRGAWTGSWFSSWREWRMRCVSVSPQRLIYDGVTNLSFIEKVDFTAIWMIFWLLVWLCCAASSIRAAAQGSTWGASHWWGRPPFSLWSKLSPHRTDLWCCVLLLHIGNTPHSQQKDHGSVSFCVIAGRCLSPSGHFCIKHDTLRCGIVRK